MRQGQQLVMTPQLQQAIRLLQLSNLELSQFVETELERNPLLERDDAAEAPVAASLEAAAGEASAPSDRADDWLAAERPVAETTRELDTEADNVFPDASASDLAPSGLSSWASVKQRNHVGEDDADLESILTGEVSLKDHLREQMQLVVSDPIDRLIAAYLIDLVDEAGYLTADLASVADKLGTEEARVVRVLKTLQGLEPAGVMARSLAECLELQLREQNRYDPQIAKLLENLPLLAQHNLPGLRRACGVDVDELADMIRELKQLNPKPGLKFGRVDVQVVVPDVIVRPAADGSFLVELNSDTLPRVLVNRSYYTRVSGTAKTPRDKDYLLDCLQTANWLVKSLDQRARTILRVAEEIVRQQDGFFMHGVQHLRPLNLKTVADAIKMHESTVSRVTSNKYMATPRGIFELKFFFTSAIASADGDGESHSSEAVRHRIKQLIDGESAENVLSDDRIVELLRGEGIDIARRTVAKYREAMRIASSVQRRREKRMLDRTERV